MTVTNGQLDLAPAAVSALENSLDQLELTIDEARKYGLAKIDADTLCNEVERLATEMRKKSEQTEDEKRLRAAQATFGLFQLDRDTLLHTVSDSMWDLLDALVVTAYSTDNESSHIYASDQASRYARATLHRLKFPHGRGTEARSGEYIMWDTFKNRMRDPDSRRAAVGICCYHQFAYECLEELGECLTDDNPLIRRLAVTTLRNFNDYNYDYDPDEGAPMVYFDPTPIGEELLEAKDDDDQMVSEIATTAVGELEGRSDALWEDPDEEFELPTDQAVDGHPDQWPLSGYNLARTRSAAGCQGPTTDVQVKWQFETHGRISSSPTVVDGVVYFGSHDEHVYALDAQQGRKGWSFGTDSWIGSSPAVVDNTVYIGNHHQMYALDAQTGDERWSFGNGVTTSSPAVVNDTVYFGSHDNHVYALDAQTGEERWKFETGNKVWSSPAVVDDTVYVGNHDNHVYALDTQTGEERWTFETGNEIRSSPAVVNDTVYIGSHDNHVYALDAQTGEKRWAFETGAYVRSSPAVVNDTVYIGSRDKHVYALNAKTGEVRWKLETSGVGKSSPAVSDSTVYIGMGWSLYAIDGQTGEERWTFDTNDVVGSSPAVVDDTVYIGSDDGHMYALE